MNDSKPWYLSRTIIGVLISLLSKGLVALGYNPTPDIEAELVNLVLLAIGFAGDALAVYGRVKATKGIGRADPDPLGHRLRVLPVLLAIGLAAAMAGPLAACATPAADTPAQRVYALQADLNAALASVNAYVHSPDAAARPEVKQSLKSLAATAGAAALTAQDAVRRGDHPAVPAALGAARQALEELSRYLIAQRIGEAADARR